MAIKRLYDTLVGATVGVNQLVEQPTPTSSTVNGITWTFTSTSVKANGTATSNSIYALNTWRPVNIPTGHKVLNWPSPTDSNGYLITEFALRTSGGTMVYDIQKNVPFIQNVTSDASQLYVSVRVQNGNTISNFTTTPPMLIDLTAYFGSASIADYLYNLETATAGAGIAKLREWGFFTGEYIPYNAGSLESVEVTGKVVRGFNQWDEEWEVGSIDNNGQNVAYTGNMRSKNYIRVLPNTQYFATPKLRIVTYWYDDDKKYISMSPASDAAITSPPNAQYMRFRTTDAYGGAYNHDICINLSSDRNGEYEAYTAQEYDYGDDTLRGIFKLDANNQLYADGDTKTSDGVITRKYGIVDLGTLNWNGFLPEPKMAYIQFQQGVYPSSATLKANIACDKYTVVSRYEVGYSEPYTVTGIGIDGNGYLFVTSPNSNWETATDAKNALSGVYLVYELATPTTEQSTPFPSPQVCYPDGTEEFVTETGVPVGHETRYQL